GSCCGGGSTSCECRRPPPSVADAYDLDARDPRVVAVGDEVDLERTVGDGNLDLAGERRRGARAQGIAALDGRAAFEKDVEDPASRQAVLPFDEVQPDAIAAARQWDAVAR